MASKKMTRREKVPAGAVIWGWRFGEMCGQRKEGKKFVFWAFGKRNERDEDDDVGR